MPSYRVNDAASLLGVSDDTVRRWLDSGRLTSRHDAAGRIVIDGSALALLATSLAGDRDELPSAGSARNRFPGIVTKVERDGVMAQVEVQAGPHRVVSLMSREAADELRLEPGVRAVAVVKATNVVVEVASSR